MCCEEIPDPTTPRPAAGWPERNRADPIACNAGPSSSRMSGSSSAYLEATVAFFTDLGLRVLGRDTVSGEWTETAVGLDGNHANIAMLERQTATVVSSSSSTSTPVPSTRSSPGLNEIGMHRVQFSVDDLDEALEIAARHGRHPLCGVATHEDVYKLTHLRGPAGSSSCSPRSCGRTEPRSILIGPGTARRPWRRSGKASFRRV
jgi:glyoxylase I family protein